jgi:pyruvate dehydrogenase E1 component alpha subunit
MVFADQSAEPPLEDVWKHTWVAEGEPDEKPRQRVRGVEVTWPSHPTQFEVKWDLEPKEAPVPAVQQKKGAA